MHQAVSPFSIVNCDTAECGGALAAMQHGTATKSSQQAPIAKQAPAPGDLPVQIGQAGTKADDNAQSYAQTPHDFDASARSLPPTGQDQTCGQLSKTLVEQADKARGQVSPSRAKADAVQASEHAGTDQITQPDSPTVSERQNTLAVPEPQMGSSLCTPGPTGIHQADPAVDEHHRSPSAICMHPDSAHQVNGIGSQSAPDVTMEQSDAVMHPVAVAVVDSSKSSGCQREASGAMKQLQAQGDLDLDNADHSSRPEAQVSAGGHPEPQNSTDGPQEALRAEHSPSAGRSSSKRHSSPSSQAAEDAPQCSPADDEPVLQENQALLPSAKRHSHSPDKAGMSVVVNKSGASNSQDPGSLPRRFSQSSDKTAASSKSDGRAVTNCGETEAANKENDVSSASLAASDSHARAQALIEEEQAKAAVIAAAQVDAACLLHAASYLSTLC